ncbi:MAG: peptidylprolyl isomerase, partial [Mycobacterium sp.]|nr:peptidylprolyl isomerase [Mycobacterium sp.]
MPTNEQRRENAKRKLERQIERRARQAKRRRIVLIAAGAIVAVAVVVAVVLTIINTKHEHNTTTATSSSPASSSAQTTATTPGQTPQAPALPPFKPSANLGANCQYPASADPAAKKVKPPRTGKVPTDPAQVSASMVTN